MSVLPVSTEYTANPKRYDHIAYRRCGCSGIHLPIISLGLAQFWWGGYFRKLSGNGSYCI